MKMKLIFLLILSTSIFGQSISELSLIHEKTGNIINYYDSSLTFLDIVATEVQGLENIKLDNSKIIEGDGFILKTRFSTNDFSVRDEIFEYYTIDTLKIYKDFMTIRGVNIGSCREKVIKLYPNSRLYREGSYYWENIDWVYEKGKILPSGISSMKIMWDFGKRKRPHDLNNDLIYGFTFHFDHDGYVEMIELGFLHTAP